MGFKEVTNNEQYEIYTELIECATSLGYRLQISKTKDLIHNYLHPKTRERVLKFSYSNKTGFVVHLKFHETKKYSPFFHEAIRKTIEESNFRYTGCYPNCTKCDGTLGYTYTYPNKDEYFRCYTELIELFELSKSEVSEMKTLLKNQL